MLRCVLAAVVLCFLAAGQPSLKPGRKYNTVERLAPERLEAVHAARLVFARRRQNIPPVGVYEDYKGVAHVHAEDAAHTLGKRQEVLAAARETGVRVVLWGDHGGPKPETWRGLRDGVLFIPGGENGAKHELTYPGLGLRFQSHVEGAMDTPPDGWAGMEIYNRHADAEDDTDLVDYLKGILRSDEKLKALAALCQKYPDEIFGAGVDYWPDIFARWDRIQQTRPFTGIAANDAHQNQVFEDERIGRMTLDPYAVAFRNTATHILARELTESAIGESLRAGRVYVSHDWLCDASGFAFVASNSLGVYQLGDTIPLLGRTQLVASAPLPATWKVFQDGKLVLERKEDRLTMPIAQPGVYRVEAWLEVDGEQRPWIYSNVIRAAPLDLLSNPLPSQNLSQGIEAMKDVEYARGPADEGAKHKLDVYRKTGAAQAPVAFFVHGGAWTRGDRSQYPFLGNLFASAGYVTVIPSYRLAPQYPYPAQIEDTAAAFAWTVKNIAQQGGDPKRIYLVGHSAGAHLVSLLVTNPKWLAGHGLTPRSIRAVAALSGAYDITAIEGHESRVFGSDPAVWRDASPVLHAKTGLPPMLLTYCQWDYTPLPQQTKAFYEALRGVNVKSSLVYIPGKSHISEMTEIVRENDPSAAAIFKFFEENR